MKDAMVRVRKTDKDTIGEVLKQRKMSWSDLISQLAQPIKDIAEVGEGSSRIELIVKLVL